MSIKSILVPVRGDGKGESVLGLAAAFAEGFGAHIDVVHVHAKPEDLLPFGVPVPRGFRNTILEAADNLARQEEDRVRDLLQGYCKARGLALVDAVEREIGGVEPTVAWHEEMGKQAQVVARLGRLADLIVIPKPDRQANLGLNTLEAALFEVRGLTAIAPREEVQAVGRNIAVAWNGSVEAARVVRRALPLLARAQRVSILTGAGDQPAHLDAEALRRYLRLHGIESVAEAFESKHHDIGGPLLESARDLGADLLVMGAFGSEKRREFVLGGVTQHVIEHADLPLLMAH